LDDLEVESADYVDAGFVMQENLQKLPSPLREKGVY